VKNKPNLASGATLAGALLFAMPALDLILGAADPSPVHAVVGSFGLLLFAVAAVANAGKEA
jgi:hypothetical protein